MEKLRVIDEAIAAACDLLRRFLPYSSLRACFAAARQLALATQRFGCLASENEPGWLSTISLARTCSRYVFQPGRFGRE